MMAAPGEKHAQDLAIAEGISAVLSRTLLRNISTAGGALSLV